MAQHWAARELGERTKACPRAGSPRALAWGWVSIEAAGSAMCTVAGLSLGFLESIVDGSHVSAMDTGTRDVV